MFIQNEDGIINKECDAFLVDLYNDSIHKNVIIDRDNVEIWLKDVDDSLNPCYLITCEEIEMPDYVVNIVLSSNITDNNKISFSELYKFLSNNYYNEYFRIYLQHKNKTNFVCCKKIEYVNLENVGYVILFS